MGLPAIPDSINLLDLSQGLNDWYNVPVAMRRALQLLALHMIDHNEKFKEIEKTKQDVDFITTPSVQEYLEGKQPSLSHSPFEVSEVSPPSTRSSPKSHGAITASPMLRPRPLGAGTPSSAASKASSLKAPALGGAMVSMNLEGAVNESLIRSSELSKRIARAEHKLDQILTQVETRPERGDLGHALHMKADISKVDKHISSTDLAIGNIENQMSITESRIHALEQNRKERESPLSRDLGSARLDELSRRVGQAERDLDLAVKEAADLKEEIIRKEEHWKEMEQRATQREAESKREARMILETRLESQLQTLRSEMRESAAAARVKVEEDVRSLQEQLTKDYRLLELEMERRARKYGDEGTEELKRLSARMAEQLQDMDTKLQVVGKTAKETLEGSPASQRPAAQLPTHQATAPVREVAEDPQLASVSSVELRSEMDALASRMDSHLKELREQMGACKQDKDRLDSQEKKLLEMMRTSHLNTQETNTEIGKLQDDVQQIISQVIGLEGEMQRCFGTPNRPGSASSTSEEGSRPPSPQVPTDPSNATDKPPRSPFFPVKETTDNLAAEIVGLKASLDEMRNRGHSGEVEAKLDEHKMAMHALLDSMAMEMKASVDSMAGAQAELQGVVLQMTDQYTAVPKLEERLNQMITEQVGIRDRSDVRLEEVREAMRAEMEARLIQTAGLTTDQANSLLHKALAGAQEAWMEDILRSVKAQQAEAAFELQKQVNEARELVGLSERQRESLAIQQAGETAGLTEKVRGLVAQLDILRRSQEDNQENVESLGSQLEELTRSQEESLESLGSQLETLMSSQEAQGQETRRALEETRRAQEETRRAQEETRRAQEEESRLRMSQLQESQEQQQQQQQQGMGPEEAEAVREELSGLRRALLELPGMREELGRLRGELGDMHATRDEVNLLRKDLEASMQQKEPLESEAVDRINASIQAYSKANSENVSSIMEKVSLKADMRELQTTKENVDKLSDILKKALNAAEDKRIQEEREVSALRDRLERAIQQADERKVTSTVEAARLSERIEEMSSWLRRVEEEAQGGSQRSLEQGLSLERVRGEMQAETQDLTRQTQELKQGLQDEAHRRDQLWQRTWEKIDSVAALSTKAAIAESKAEGQVEQQQQQQLVARVERALAELGSELSTLNSAKATVQECQDLRASVQRLGVELDRVRQSGEGTRDEIGGLAGKLASQLHQVGSLESAVREVVGEVEGQNRSKAQASELLEVRASVTTLAAELQAVRDQHSDITLNLDGSSQIERRVMDVMKDVEERGEASRAELKKELMGALQEVVDRMTELRRAIVLQEEQARTTVEENTRQQAKALVEFGVSMSEKVDSATFKSVRDATAKCLQELQEDLASLKDNNVGHLTTQMSEIRERQGDVLDFFKTQLKEVWTELKDLRDGTAFVKDVEPALRKDTRKVQEKLEEVTREVNVGLKAVRQRYLDLEEGLHKEIKETRDGILKMMKELKENYLASGPRRGSENIPKSPQSDLKQVREEMEAEIRSLKEGSFGLGGSMTKGVREVRAELKDDMDALTRDMMEIKAEVRRAKDNRSLFEEGITNSVEEVREHAREGLVELVRGVVEMREEMKDLKDVRDEVRSMKSNLEARERFEENLQDSVDEVRVQSRDGIDTIVKRVRMMRDEFTNLKEMHDEYKQFKESRVRFEEGVATEIEEMRSKAWEAIDEVNKATGELKEDLSKTNEAVLEMKQEGETFREELGALNEELVAANEQMTEVVGEVETLRGNAEEAKEAIDAVRNEIGRLGERVSDVVTEVTGLSENAQSVKEDLVTAKELMDSAQEERTVLKDGIINGLSEVRGETQSALKEMASEVINLKAVLVEMKEDQVQREEEFLNRMDEVQAEGTNALATWKSNMECEMEKLQSSASEELQIKNSASQFQELEARFTADLKQLETKSQECFQELSKDSMECWAAMKTMKEDIVSRVEETTSNSLKSARAEMDRMFQAETAQRTSTCSNLLTQIQNKDKELAALQDFTAGMTKDLRAELAEFEKKIEMQAADSLHDVMANMDKYNHQLERKDAEIQASALSLRVLVDDKFKAFQDRFDSIQSSTQTTQENHAAQLGKMFLTVEKLTQDHETDQKAVEHLRKSCQSDIKDAISDASRNLLEKVESRVGGIAEGSDDRVRKMQEQMMELHKKDLSVLKQESDQNKEHFRATLMTELARALKEVQRVEVALSDQLAQSETSLGQRLDRQGQDLTALNNSLLTSLTVVQADLARFKEAESSVCDTVASLQRQVEEAPKVAADRQLEKESVPGGLSLAINMMHAAAEQHEAVTSQLQAEVQALKKQTHVDLEAFEELQAEVYCKLNRGELESMRQEIHVALASKVDVPVFTTVEQAVFGGVDRKSNLKTLHQVQELIKHEENERAVENGRLASELDHLRQHLEAAEQNHQARATSLEDRLAALDQDSARAVDLEALQISIGQVADDVAGVSSELRQVSETAARNEEEVGELQRSIEDLGAAGAGLEAVQRAVEALVQDMEERVRKEKEEQEHLDTLLAERDQTAMEQTQEIVSRAVGQLEERVDSDLREIREVSDQHAALINQPGAGSVEKAELMSLVGHMESSAETALQQQHASIMRVLQEELKQSRTEVKEEIEEVAQMWRDQLQGHREELSQAASYKLELMERLDCLEETQQRERKEALTAAQSIDTSFVSLRADVATCTKNLEESETALKTLLEQSTKVSQEKCTSELKLMQDQVEKNVLEGNLVKTELLDHLKGADKSMRARLQQDIGTVMDSVKELERIFLEQRQADLQEHVAQVQEARGESQRAKEELVQAVKRVEMETARVAVDLDRAAQVLFEKAREETGQVVAHLKEELRTETAQAVGKLGNATDSEMSVLREESRGGLKTLAETFADTVRSLREEAKENIIQDTAQLRDDLTSFSTREMELLREEMKTLNTQNIAATIALGEEVKENVGTQITSLQDDLTELISQDVSSLKDDVSTLREFCVQELTSLQESGARDAVEMKTELQEGISRVREEMKSESDRNMGTLREEVKEAGESAALALTKVGESATESRMRELADMAEKLTQEVARQEEEVARSLGVVREDLTKEVTAIRGEMKEDRKANTEQLNQRLESMKTILHQAVEDSEAGERGARQSLAATVSEHQSSVLALRATVEEHWSQHLVLKHQAATQDAFLQDLPKLTKQVTALQASEAARASQAQIQEEGLQRMKEEIQEAHSKQSLKMEKSLLQVADKKLHAACVELSTAIERREAAVLEKLQEEVACNETAMKKLESKLRSEIKQHDDLFTAYKKERKGVERSEAANWTQALEKKASCASLVAVSSVVKQLATDIKQLPSTLAEMKACMEDLSCSVEKLKGEKPDKLELEEMRTQAVTSRTEIELFVDEKVMKLNSEKAEQLLTLHMELQSALTSAQKPIIEELKELKSRMLDMNEDLSSQFSNLEAKVPELISAANSEQDTDLKEYIGSLNKETIAASQDRFTLLKSQQEEDKKEMEESVKEMESITKSSVTQLLDVWQAFEQATQLAAQKTQEQQEAWRSETRKGLSSSTDSLRADLRDCQSKISQDLALAIRTSEDSGKLSLEKLEAELFDQLQAKFQLLSEAGEEQRKRTADLENAAEVQKSLGRSLEDRVEEESRRREGLEREAERSQKSGAHLQKELERVEARASAVEEVIKEEARRIKGVEKAVELERTRGEKVEGDLRAVEEAVKVVKDDLKERVESSMLTQVLGDRERVVLDEVSSRLSGVESWWSAQLNSLRQSSEESLGRIAQDAREMRRELAENQHTLRAHLAQIAQEWTDNEKRETETKIQELKSLVKNLQGAEKSIIARADTLEVGLEHMAEQMGEQKDALLSTISERLHELVSSQDDKLQTQSKRLAEFIGQSTKQHQQQQTANNSKVEELKELVTEKVDTADFKTLQEAVLQLSQVMSQKCLTGLDDLETQSEKMQSQAQVCSQEIAKIIEELTKLSASVTEIQKIKADCSELNHMRQSVSSIESNISSLQVFETKTQELHQSFTETNGVKAKELTEMQSRLEKAEKSLESAQEVQQAQVEDVRIALRQLEEATKEGLSQAAEASSQQGEDLVQLSKTLVEFESTLISQCQQDRDATDEAVSTLHQAMLQHRPPELEILANEVKEMEARLVSLQEKASKDIQQSLEADQTTANDLRKEDKAELTRLLGQVEEQIQNAQVEFRQLYQSQEEAARVAATWQGQMSQLAGQQRQLLGEMQAVERRVQERVTTYAEEVEARETQLREDVLNKSGVKEEEVRTLTSRFNAVERQQGLALNELEQGLQAWRATQLAKDQDREHKLKAWQEQQGTVVAAWGERQAQALQEQKQELVALLNKTQHQATTLAAKNKEEVSKAIKGVLVQASEQTLKDREQIQALRTELQSDRERIQTLRDEHSTTLRELETRTREHYGNCVAEVWTGLRKMEKAGKEQQDRYFVESMRAVKEVHASVKAADKSTKEEMAALKTGTQDSVRDLVQRSMEETRVAAAEAAEAFSRSHVQSCMEEARARLTAQSEAFTKTCVDQVREHAESFAKSCVKEQQLQQSDSLGTQLQSVQSRLGKHEEGLARLHNDTDAAIRTVRLDLTALRDSTPKLLQFQSLCHRVELVHREVGHTQERLTAAHDLISAIQDADTATVSTTTPRSNLKTPQPDSSTRNEALPQSDPVPTTANTTTTTTSTAANEIHTVTNTNSAETNANANASTSMMVEEVEARVGDLLQRKLQEMAGRLQREVQVKERQFQDDAALLAADLQALAQKQQQHRLEVSEALDLVTERSQQGLHQFEEEAKVSREVREKVEAGLRDMRDQLSESVRVQREELEDSQSEVRELCQRLREDLSGNHLNAELKIQEKMNQCENELQDAVRNAELALKTILTSDSETHRASLEGLEKRVEAEMENSKSFSLEVSQSLELVSSELAKVQQDLSADRTDVASISENERAMKEKLSGHMEAMKLSFRSEWEKQNGNLAEVARAVRILEERHGVDKQAHAVLCQHLKAGLVELQQSEADTKTMVESLQVSAETRGSTWENMLLDLRGQNEQWKMELLEKLGPLTRFSEGVKEDIKNIITFSEGTKEDIRLLKRFAENAKVEMETFSSFSELMKADMENLTMSANETRDDLETLTRASKVLRDELATLTVAVDFNRKEIEGLSAARSGSDLELASFREHLSGMQGGINQQLATNAELRELIKCESGSMETLRQQLYTLREETATQSQQAERRVEDVRDTLLQAMASKADITDLQEMVDSGLQATKELTQLRDKLESQCEETLRLKEVEEVSSDQMLVLSRQMRQVHSSVADATDTLKGDLHQLGQSLSDLVQEERQTREADLRSLAEKLESEIEAMLALSQSQAEIKEQASRLQSHLEEVSGELRGKADQAVVEARHTGIDSKLEAIERNLAYIKTEAASLEESLSLSDAQVQRHDQHLSQVQKSLALKPDNSEVEDVVSKMDMAVVNICDELSKLRSRAERKDEETKMTAETLRGLEKRISEINSEMTKFGQLMIKLKETTASSQQLSAAKAGLAEVQRSAADLAAKVDELSSMLSDCASATGRKANSEEVRVMVESVRSDLERLQSQVQKDLVGKAEVRALENLTAGSDTKLSELENRIRAMGTDAENSKDIFLTTHQIVTDMLVKMEVMSKKIDTTALSVNQKTYSEGVLSSMDSRMEDLSGKLDEVRFEVSRRIEVNEKGAVNADRIVADLVTRQAKLEQQFSHKVSQFEERGHDFAHKNEVGQIQEVLGKLESKVVELLTRTGKLKTEALSKIDSKQVHEIVSKLGGKMAQLSEQVADLQTNIIKSPTELEFQSSFSMVENHLSRLRDELRQDLATKADLSDFSNIVSRQEAAEEGLRVSSLVDEVTALRSHLESTSTSLREAISRDQQERHQTWQGLVQSMQKLRESHSLDAMERQRMQVETIASDSLAQVEKLRTKTVDLESLCKRTAAELAAEVQRREVFGPPLESMLKDKLRMQNTLDVLQAEVSEVKVANNKFASELDRRIEHSELVALLDHKAPVTQMNRLEDRVRCMEVATRVQSEIRVQSDINEIHTSSLVMESL